MWPCRHFCTFLYVICFRTAGRSNPIERESTTTKWHQGECISSSHFHIIPWHFATLKRLSVVPNTPVFLRAGVALLQGSEKNHAFWYFFASILFCAQSDAFLCEILLAWLEWAAVLSLKLHRVLERYQNSYSKHANGGDNPTFFFN